MNEGNELPEIRPTGQTDSSEKLIIRDRGFTNINKENLIQEKEEEKGQKINSFSTVLSIWNSMLGSSAVSLPYYVYCSGIIPALFLSIIYGLICFYTCKVYVDFGDKEPDFSITIEKYFKKKFGEKIAKLGKAIQIIFSILITLGGTLIYFLIINQNLYPVVCLILNKLGLNIDSKDLTPEFSRFSLVYLGIILCIIMFPLTIKKDIGFLIKLSSFGIYFISILIIFVIYTGISSLINTDFSFDYIINKPNTNERHLKLFGENPIKFAGALSLGYFCHNTVLPVLQNNKKQENNTRDLFLGYCLVCLTFSSCGILGYIGFSGKEFDVDFKDNWFMFFDYDDYYILFFRLLNVIQLITVFPILVYVIRYQIFIFIYDNEYPSRMKVIIYGISTLFLCLVVLYFFYNFLADFLRIVGASTSLILIYTFPPIIKIISFYMKLKGESIEDNEVREKLSKNIEDNNENIEKDENEENKKNKNENENEDKKNKISFKDIVFIIGQILIILIGIATVVFQFVEINFFNISLQE